MKPSLVLALTLATFAAGAAESVVPSLEIAGSISEPGKLTIQELQALGPVTRPWKEHGKTHQVTGVPIQKILAARGFSPGPEGKNVPVTEKRAGWRKVLVAVAADGYQAAFSCAELSDEIGATKVLVVWSVDGKPLRTETGPLRLVSPSDHEPSRSVFKLERLVLVDVTQ
ncbi:MAG TPA: molybdopterin-dependent oxidoreductase [Anaeromyxobacteraceae bacterium]|nr:molybdopterin-dependent oxidoreductase [Anaeromyxobacteraceae bacterium]